jgi:hypothetical protein
MESGQLWREREYKDSALQRPLKRCFPESEGNTSILPFDDSC